MYRLEAEFRYNMVPGKAKHFDISRQRLGRTKEISGANVRHKYSNIESRSPTINSCEVDSHSCRCKIDSKDLEIIKSKVET